MEVGLSLQPHTRAWLKQSALDAHVSEYCAYLEVHGYAASTQRVYLGCVALCSLDAPGAARLESAR
jgi:hypothetical protein